MKISSLTIALAIALFAAAGAFASDKAVSGSKQKPAAKDAPAKKITLPKPQAKQYTGSYIPQNLRQSGHITDGSNPLYVIDSTMIRNSGASDVRQLLTQRGMAH